MQFRRQEQNQLRVGEQIILVLYWIWEHFLPKAKWAMPKCPPREFEEGFPEWDELDDLCELCESSALG